jgi:hypothetical protein
MATASTAAKRVKPILVVTFIAPEEEEEEPEPELGLELEVALRSGTAGPVAEAPTPAIAEPDGA